MQIVCLDSMHPHFFPFDFSPAPLFSPSNSHSLSLVNTCCMSLVMLLRAQGSSVGAWVASQGLWLFPIATSHQPPVTPQMGWHLWTMPPSVKILATFILHMSVIPALRRIHLWLHGKLKTILDMRKWDPVWKKKIFICVQWLYFSNH